MHDMKDKPLHLRPREKLFDRGLDSLHNHELFSILLGFGIKGRSVEELSKSLAQVSPQVMKRMTSRELLSMPGLGRAKVATVLAAIELGKRFFSPKSEVEVKVEKTEDVLPLLRGILTGRQEKIVAIYLSASHMVLDTQVIAIGTSTMCIAHPRDILWHGIVAGAVGVIIAHNHPSGSLEVSEADRQFTRRLDEACDLVGFALLDHLIITKQGWARVE